ncbi:DNA helicase [Mycolicibacterium cyprinidarum]|uniref:DNA 3'-5' helicase n=1 Tax=Mycolicibacterium cyprinidarum TaxID=2860311 RepID=A0ABQ4VDZ0_9MYCO|nr:DNA helicase [Mycolicibacterium sp. NGTWSNA01]GJF14451.1 DNA helicase [Mycolicibacterium sp. NGTWS1803]GJF16678.1 DNA helicase [Mycolicibacterium sp. NGTWS0302]
MSAPHIEFTAAALDGRELRGTVRVLGGAGTGKSSLLVDTAVAHISAGCDPESVLLLTGSARLGAQAKAAITATLLSSGDRTVVREPLVRTVHSYAFAVMRLAAQRNGSPPPRLITSAEQDGIIRELLAGNVEDGDACPVRWPARLRPALATVGFATELRDLLARCSERGIDPAALQRIGRVSGRAEWQAAGRFAQVYEQVMLLRSAVGMAAPQATVPALGAAELVGAALEAFAMDADLLAAERARVKLLLVDDIQHLDPQAARLVQVLAAGAELTVLAGDPRQAVFGYRGADPALLRGEGPVLVLTESHRCAAPLADAMGAIARRLPGRDPAPVFTGTDAAGALAAGLAVRIAASSHAEAALIADALRRAHLIEGVPWTQMAVIVRSVPRMGASLGRALKAAGVPVEMPRGDSALADQPAVRALLTVLEATANSLDGERALALLTGPIGRVDPVSLRQLRRALRRTAPGSSTEFGDLLVDALQRGSNGLADGQARALQRVRAVLEAAQRSAEGGGDPRHTLWQAWNRSGLQKRWLTVSERGGPAGAQADSDLDAVTAMFDIAEHYIERTAGASLRGLIDHIAALAFAPVRRDDGPQSDAVAVLSAHSALSREWDFVVIAGVQEGLWPNVSPRGGVLATQELVDVMDGVAEAGQRGLSSRAPLLAEERRLLIAAMGRARRRLLVTAVDSDGDDAMLPSSFCRELSALATVSVADDCTPIQSPRVLAQAALVGRLRSVVCSPLGAVTDAERDCAAVQLARLAEAGVSGADPASWYGARELSSEDPLWSGDEHVVTLSPSTLQTLSDCPLRWLLERHGGSAARDVRSVLGSLVHALVSEPGRSESQMFNELEKIWGQIPFDAQWHADNELHRHLEMLSTFLRWRAATRHELTELGTEVDVEGEVTGADGEQPAVCVRGRLDRLERDSQGRLVVVDIKTAKSPVSKDAAQSHAQLAMYQLAVAEGLLADGDEPGGGRLVYVGKSSGDSATERDQAALTPEGHAEWHAVVQQAAAATQGPQFLARINDGCAHCPVRTMCPAQDTGRGPR